VRGGGEVRWEFPPHVKDLEQRWLKVFRDFVTHWMEGDGIVVLPRLAQLGVRGAMGRPFCMSLLGRVGNTFVRVRIRSRYP